MALPQGPAAALLAVAVNDLLAVKSRDSEVALRPELKRLVRSAMA